MIESPTPETDALFWRNGYPVVVDSSKAMQLCEKLEQERDWITEKFKLLEGCFKRAERERDEAREALRILAEHGESEIHKLQNALEYHVSSENNEWLKKKKNAQEESQKLVKHDPMWQKPLSTIAVKSLEGAK